jgi:broad specificity phosphatase PhoE
MKTVYLIRHGQTEANTGGPYFGDRDKLTTEGRAQAGKVAERCTKLPLEVILSSTMDRAVETAAIIANACGISHESFDEFKESREPASLHGR